MWRLTLVIVYLGNKIPVTFQSHDQYLGSFVIPLLENTRAELASSMESMRTAPRAEVLSLRNTNAADLVEFTVGCWINKHRARGRAPYRTLPGDVLITVDRKPLSLSDLNTMSWSLLLVQDILPENDGLCKFLAHSLHRPQVNDGVLVIYLMNVTTGKRVWKSLKMNTNLNIVEHVLDDMGKEDCEQCVLNYEQAAIDQQIFNDLLNSSQQEAIKTALSKISCFHKSSVDLIWGPPGTGKTKTIGVLLYHLLKMNCRTLLCAPTNFSIRQVATSLLNLVKKSPQVSVGDVLLFGNRERLAIAVDIEEVYLEKRVEQLTECVGLATGWMSLIKGMNELLEDPPHDQFAIQYALLEKKLSKCVHLLLAHLPTNFVEEESRECMENSLTILGGFESVVSADDFSEEILVVSRDQPLDALQKLGQTLEGLELPDENGITKFCLEKAPLVMCTSSHSYNLHLLQDEPFQFLVIDEAAQLKEAETTIPLQLPGIMHVVLVGDECQLPAMVTSNMAAKWEFGRSLFGRLSFLGHPKKLLNVQYRMHPSISLFPNRKFYNNQIMDAETVRSEGYRKSYLNGEMFGSYSFINVSDGREEKDAAGGSRMNMVEVAVVVTIIKMLHQGWEKSKNNITIAVLSPYAAQVLRIQERLEHFKNCDGFFINVKTIDGFQGGESDIVIVSTVQSSYRESTGFLSSPQRINTSLTRARHCLWIVGNGRTLETNESVWKDLIHDARSRRCYFDAASNKSLQKAVIQVKKDLKEYEDLISGDSVLFKNEKWKVVFSEDFRRSFKSFDDDRLKKLILLLLSKLASGWRPKNTTSVTSPCKNSAQCLNQFKVENLYVICTIDIIKELCYTQVLKVWDVLPLEEIPKLKSRLEKLFSSYTEDFNSLCTTKQMDGDLQVPLTWLASQEIIRFRDLSRGGEGDEGEVVGGEAEDEDVTYIENTKVNESLLLMKFYPMSDGVANHLLTDEELDLPIQLTDEQKDIVLFPRTSFIIGRSGTGKTTVLTSKLLRKEEIFHHQASQGVNVIEDGKDNVLRQLFVTVSPILCTAVKRYISQAISISHNGNPSDDDERVTPDTFINIPKENYPLIITFKECLMMLDGTLGTSFFERLGYGKDKEVTFERFYSCYWQHFDTKLKKNLDPSRVFTEIISYLKGGSGSERKLRLDEYKSLARGRTSNLSEKQRGVVYKLFEKYEDLKTKQHEFDLADLVIDLHSRYKVERYKGDPIDFVYIDEVQDLSMNQICLFKYICTNAEEGFVFAGDTAQTIARGVDFRFEDVKSLFFTEFLRTGGEQQKGTVSDVFRLKQNMRTHAGVLNLAQSVIEIIYHYFPESVDRLDPEISFIFGETPIVLEMKSSEENAIVQLFGDGEKWGQTFEFGAEQVILVRNDATKDEVCETIGDKALVLTIVECKGLEFRDVLLYKFFGKSELNQKWRVVYNFMAENGLLDDKGARLKKEANHTTILCGELKDLYVAITRTRQRLWICEEKEDLSKSGPMVAYWEKKGLIQKQKLDDSMAKAMQVKSSSQEWLSRGKQLFDMENYAMATMCFEKAKDQVWEVRARAYEIRASAHQVKESKPKSFEVTLKRAVEMLRSLGETEAESVALFEYELEEYSKRDGMGKIDTSIAECSSSPAPEPAPEPAPGPAIRWNVLEEFVETLTQNPELVGSIVPYSAILEELEKLEDLINSHRIFDVGETSHEDARDELAQARLSIQIIRMRINYEVKYFGRLVISFQLIATKLREVMLYVREHF